MINKTQIKLIISGLLFLLLLAWLGEMYVNIVSLPERDPDRMLRIEQRVDEFFERITLPIKMTRLRAQEPDKQIIMPVYGKRVRDIADTWGSPRGDDRTHEGQDVFANTGTPVFSATKGYVVRKDNSTLGGNYVFIMGAGGVRYYYAHLNRFAEDVNVGDLVNTDTVIGYVGATGNAEGTPPHLHFGVYVNREAVNPLSLLIDR